MAPKVAQIDKLIDLAQQMVGGNPILKTELVEQLAPIVPLPPHHLADPRKSVLSNRITRQNNLQPTSATKSAKSCRSLSRAPGSVQDV
jgi:hypothetical protein